MPTGSVYGASDRAEVVWVDDPIEYGDQGSLRSPICLQDKVFDIYVSGVWQDRDDALTLLGAGLTIEFTAFDLLDFDALGFSE